MTHTNIPILIQKLKSIYCDWSIIQKNIPKIHRYSLGIKIDTNIIVLIEYCFVLISTKDILLLTKIIAKIDMLKLLIQILFDVKGIDQKTYIRINEKIEEVGKIVFGIKRNLENKNHLHT